MDNKVLILMVLLFPFHFSESYLIFFKCISGIAPSALATFLKKCERIHLNEYFSIHELKTDMDNYINFYNFERIHQTLKYQNLMGDYQNELTNIAA